MQERFLCVCLWLLLAPLIQTFIRYLRLRLSFPWRSLLFLLLVVYCIGCVMRVVYCGVPCLTIASSVVVHGCVHCLANASTATHLHRLLTSPAEEVWSRMHT